MYYDNEMIGELIDKEFDEMMGEMQYTTDSNDEFVGDSFSTLEEEEVEFEVEEMEEMEEMGEAGFLDEGIDEKDKLTMMTLEPAE